MGEIRFTWDPAKARDNERKHGVAFEEARSNVVRGTYGSVEVSFIGFDDIIRNKKATRRPKDRGDVEELTQDEDAEGT